MAVWTLLVQVASTLAMVGLIWFIQVVHYPLFSRVGSDKFDLYETDHQRLTTYVVMPLMLAELASAIMMFRFRLTDIETGMIWFGIALIAAIWLITFTVQVPQHGLLEKGFDADVHRGLVAGNWWRTGLWTVRGALVLWMVGHLATHPISQAVAR